MIDLSEPMALLLVSRRKTVFSLMHGELALYPGIFELLKETRLRKIQVSSPGMLGLREKRSAILALKTPPPQRTKGDIASAMS